MTRLRLLSAQPQWSMDKIVYWFMPKKIRELKQLLRQAGFTELPGKGSHTS